MILDNGICYNCSKPLLKLHPLPEPGGQPRAALPGDPILCGHCGAVGYLEEGGSTVRPAAADIDYWRMTRPETWRVLRAVQAEILNRQRT